MSGMPYVLDKGILFSFIDSRYSGSKEDRLALLTQLRNPSLTMADFSTSAPSEANVESALDTGSQPGRQTNDARLHHLMEHWFGMTNTSGTWQVDTSKHTTGAWAAWQGDAHGIFRQTLAAAIEVSLGVPVDSNPTAASATTRLWPVDTLWICGSPRFEGWISWRGWKTADPSTPNETQQGIVTVIFATPGGQSPLSARLSNDDTIPKANRLIHDVDDYWGPTSSPPLKTKHQYGMLVVGHEISEVKPESDDSSASSMPSTPGTWKLPMRSPGHKVSGVGQPVIVLRPSELDGGVLKAGRQWQ